MKIIILVVMIALSGFLVADEVYPILNQKEVRDEYLSNYGVVRALDLKGSIICYAIAKESGDIIAATKFEDKEVLSYIALNGDIIWTKELDCSSVDISDDGGIVLMQNSLEYYESEYFVIDKKGNIIHEAKLWKKTYRLSPDGRFFVLQDCAMWGGLNEAVIFDHYNEKHYLPLEENYEIKSATMHYIGYDKLIASFSPKYDEKSFVCFQFKDGKFKQIWSKGKEYSNVGDTFNNAIKSYQNWTGINSYNHEFRLLNNETGALLYEWDGAVLTWAISQAGNILINSDSLLYLSQDKDMHYNLTPIYSRIKFCSLQDFCEIDSNYFINVNTGGTKNDFDAMLYTEGEMYILHTKYYARKANNRDYLIEVNLREGSDIVIYRKGLD
ncbi:MAG: hypothetical protein K9M99_12180 [Candidatus Cloacimonetes bacterium]|nr:hypothetical protein [Candidatus Cloacimonadota bacterium]